MKTFIVSFSGNCESVAVDADYFNVGSFHNATFYRTQNGESLPSHYFASVSEIKLQDKPDESNKP